jgi:undecaprenyl-diphosphatase
VLDIVENGKEPSQKVITVPLRLIMIIALLQGLTEFLPISSSGHLVLAWEAFDLLELSVPGFSDKDRLTIDIAVHVGTLFAVVLYFRADVLRLIKGFWTLCRRRSNANSELFLKVLVASIPVIIAGLLVKEFAAILLRSPWIIAVSTILFGLLLWFVDRSTMTVRKLDHISYKEALFIGFMQVLALIPGTSRSGITMTAGRVLGMERAETARFSMLLAIPAIGGAGALAGLDLIIAGDTALNQGALWAVVVSFMTALVAIWAMMGWLRRANFTVFVIYRLMLGALLIAAIYTGVIAA